MRIKKTQKGFTLIELIIVMAIFGIIMLGVMKIADPLARVMSRSSVKEQSAANVDNISDYLDHSLRYAKYMSVYEGELPDSGYSNTEAMVKDFVTAFYDGCIDSKFQNMKGKLHVVNIINQDTYLKPDRSTASVTVGGNSVKPGEIWESVYSFTSGTSFVDEDGDTIEKKAPECSMLSCNMVINPDYLKDYSYFYSYGYSKFEATDHPDSRTTYFELVPESITIDSNRFAMSIVAYREGNMIDVSGKRTFVSPCYMNTLSMYLINAGGVASTDLKKVLKADGTEEMSEDGLSPKVEKVVPTRTQFKKYPAAGAAPASGSTNLTFIYVIPSELYLD